MQTHLHKLSLTEDWLWVTQADPMVYIHSKHNHAIHLRNSQGSPHSWTDCWPTSYLSTVERESMNEKL